jgi:hypothetical protein
MLRKIPFANIGLAGLAIASALATACVADRPSRNGVFDENQYLRKDFLIAPGTGGVDQGWFVKTTIVATSTPNPLGNAGGAGLFAGAEGETANMVRFVIDQDQMSIVDLREISNDPTYNSQNTRTSEAINAWPITNVDLKYQVNLDGEKTNFYQENQELDWQLRQWVKINFAKNNLSDLFSFNDENNGTLQNCVDLGNTSVELHTGSFNVDEANGYFEYALDFTIPIHLPPPDPNAAAGTVSQADVCVAAFGPAWQTFQAMGRSNVSLTVKYSYVRPSQVTDGSYVPMPIAEKDPIQHKYGAFEFTAPYRDPNTTLLGADTYVTRHNPAKDIVYYFSPGMPAQYQKFFTQAGGLQDQTNNNVLAKTGAKGRLKFLNYNDATTLGDGQGPSRGVGDARYNFIVWHSDLDNGSQLLGVANPFVDPRTGEIISADVNVYEGPFADTVEQRLDAFLQTVGAEVLQANGDFNDNATVSINGQMVPVYPPNCQTGQTIPLVPLDVANVLNRQSTVYSKMQQYLQKPFAQYGYLGPSDFLPTHDSDFYNAYFAVLPYQVYKDPNANEFVMPESSPFATQQTNQWASLIQVAATQNLTAQIDKGWKPSSWAPADAAAFANNWQSLGQAATAYNYTQFYMPGMMAADDISLFSYFDIYQRDGRHCVNGQWESRQQYTQDLIYSLNMATATHEFGHSMGLRHNFMGSVDQRNFPLDSKGNPLIYSSSIMDYNQPIVEAFFETNAGSPVWGNYDLAAMAWIYDNDLSASKTVPLQNGEPLGTTNVSGQTSATAPWNDPLGFNNGTETTFLYCSDEHTMYTPLCQRYDMGVTPSEIVANAIQQREWNYLWTNFRLYHKYFSFQNYGTQAIADLQGFRRFQSMWLFDWSQAELTNDLQLIGFPIPAGDTAADYYTQLYNKFETDISVANQLAVGYQRAILDQASGERPYVTVYDPFYGDTTQQGIQIDKVELTTGVTNLWPAVTNFDPSQSTGLYVPTLGGIGDAAFLSVANSTLNDFLGAAFATFSYTQLGPLAVWSQATHDPAYETFGNLQYQTWIGSWTFDRPDDFLSFVRQIAINYNFQNCDENGLNCQPCTTVTGVAGCSWDPRTRQVKPTQLTQSDYVNRFVGPDGKYYIWGWLESRNQWVLAEKDRNTATYTLMYNWQTDVQYGQDTGENGANALEYPVRFAIDSFNYFDDQLPGANNGGSTGTGNGSGG